MAEISSFFQRSQQFLIAVALSLITVTLVLSKQMLLRFSLLYSSFHSDYFSVSSRRTRLNRAILLLNLLLISEVPKERVGREIKYDCVGYTSSLFKQHNNFCASSTLRRNQQRFSCLQRCYISMHFVIFQRQMWVPTPFFRGIAFCMDHSASVFGKEILEPDLQVPTSQRQHFFLRVFFPTASKKSRAKTQKIRNP